MNPNDPLSRLLKSWEPESPYSSGQIAQNVLRRIRQGRVDPLWKRLAHHWGEILEEWLPSPNAWLPVAASLVLFLGVLQWNRGVNQAKMFAAMHWHEQLSSPLAKASLSGAYEELVKK